MSSLQQQIDALQEKLDAKTQKYENIKKEMERINLESRDSDMAKVSWEEEMSIMKKRVEEAEAKYKGF